MKTQACADSMDRSKSFASLRHLPSHAKVRSTTQRRGRTSKPLALSARLMISIANPPIFCKAPRSFGPAGVGTIGNEHGSSRAQRPFAAAAPAHLQLLFPVEASQLLLVHHNALPVQHDVDPAVAEPSALRRHGPHRLTQRSVVRTDAGVAHRRTVDPQSLARPTLAHPMHRAKGGGCPGPGPVSRRPVTCH